MPIDNTKYTLLLVLSLLQQPEEMIRILSEAGFRIRQALDMRNALEMAASESLDMMLVGVDDPEAGTACLREVRRHPHTAGMPVLLVAAAANQGDLSECLIDDDVDFIIRPFQAQELVVRVQHQLSFLKAERIIRRQNERLKRTLKDRDKLYSVIAHDLRAPIGTVKMINAAIEGRKACLQDPQLARWFGMINETTEEAYHLLENLLRWTRLQNGTTKVYTAEFNVHGTIRQVCLLFQTIAAAKGIALDNMTAGILKVCADEDMVKTILRNLLSNAIKFTYPGGRIEMETQEKDRWIQVCVRDNGRGMSKEIRQKLLKRNEYVTTYGTHNEKGSGLGLVLVRDFVKLNKGSFSFHSQEGVGTTFCFTLPKAERADRLETNTDTF